MENYFGITTAIEVTNPVPSVDKFYGPYDTIAKALLDMNVIGLPGRVFGVKSNGQVELYTYQGTGVNPTKFMFDDPDLLKRTGTSIDKPLNGYYNTTEDFGIGGNSSTSGRGTTMRVSDSKFIAVNYVDNGDVTSNIELYDGGVYASVTNSTTNKDVSLTTTGLFYTDINSSGRGVGFSVTNSGFSMYSGTVDVYQPENSTPFMATSDSHVVTKRYLDSVTGTAVGNNHTHSNKAILDATTASFTTTLKTKLDGLSNYTLTSANIVSALGYTPMATTHAANGVTTALIGNWNTAFTNNHTHSNKTVLDGITAAKVSAWDAKPAGITGSKLRYVLMNPDGSFNVGVPNSGTVAKVLGLDANDNPTVNNVVNMKSVKFGTIEPTVLDLIAENVDRLDYPNLNTIYFQCGNKWIKIQGTEVL